MFSVLYNIIIFLVPNSNFTKQKIYMDIYSCFIYNYNYVYLYMYIFIYILI